MLRKTSRVYIALFLALWILPNISAQAQEVDTTGTAVYVIKEGDTLYDLAIRLAVSMDTLAEMNAITGGFLRPGSQLLIPAGKMSTSYRVRGGDTLFSLSRRFLVSVDEIRRANQMSNSTLQVDQILTIPGQGVRESFSVDEINQQSLEDGFALVYPEAQIGRMMASGDRYDSTKFTISHPSLPMGSIVLVRNRETGTQTFAEVSDRALTTQPLVFDVSEAVARKLSIDAGVAALTQIRLINVAN